MAKTIKKAPAKLVKEEKREAKMTPKALAAHEKKESSAHQKMERKYGYK